MAIYLFKCENCNVQFEEYRSIHNDEGVLCENCGEYTNTIVPQPWLHTSFGPQTLGGVADKNRTIAGKYCIDDKKQEIEQANKRLSQYAGKLPEGASVGTKPAATPWWRETPHVDMSLNKMTPDQAERYVMTGTKPL